MEPNPSEVSLSASPRVWPSLLPQNATDVSNPSLRWRLGSRLVVPAVGLFSALWMRLANTSLVHNAAVLYEALEQNYAASHPGSGALSQARAQTASPPRPLITYSNHTSCMDDPLIWGALVPFWWQFNSDRHRWSAAASEICFSKRWHSLFFALGKTFPIIRGEGIYQPAMDYAAKLMQSGQWLHFFPHGKVIPRPEHSDPQLLKFTFDEKGQPVDSKDSPVAGQKVEYSLKWGMARLIIEHVLGEGKVQDPEYDSLLRPSDPDSRPECDLPVNFDPNSTLAEVDVLPIYHVGMDEVLPTRRPYVPRVFRKVTFLVRPEGPIRIDRQFLLTLFGNHQMELSLAEKRTRLMKFFEEELERLAEKAHWMHDHLHS